jgi:hypothetical protein
MISRSRNAADPPAYLNASTFRFIEPYQSVGVQPQPKGAHSAAPGTPSVVLVSELLKADLLSGKLLLNLVLSYDTAAPKGGAERPKPAELQQIYADGPPQRRWATVRQLLSTSLALPDEWFDLVLCGSLLHVLRLVCALELLWSTAAVDPPNRWTHELYEKVNQSQLGGVEADNGAAQHTARIQQAMSQLQGQQRWFLGHLRAADEAAAPRRIHDRQSHQRPSKPPHRVPTLFREQAGIGSPLLSLQKLECDARHDVIDESTFEALAIFGDFVASL